MMNDLLLLSGTDIPFPQAQITIHQPTIKEISYIGEEALFAGAELLNFSKNKLSTQDKIHLADKNDFEILMSIIKDKNLIVQKTKIDAILVLSLMFPAYQINFEPDGISFFKEGEEKHFINDKCYQEFKEIVSTMFCLNMRSGGEDYHPEGDLANKIADKLRKGRLKAAAAKGESQKVALLSRYISILAVGGYKTINELLNYTVYQLFDEYNRFELKQQFDLYIQAKMVGAKGLEEVDNWMKDIHP